MLEQGKTLGQIKFVTAVPYDLPDKLRGVTKDTLFKISYLQCNDNYVYKVCAVNDTDVDVQNSGDHHIFRADYMDLARGKEKLCLQ